MNSNLFKPEVATLTLPDGRKRDIFHRGTEADVGVLGQIFQTQDYLLTPLTRGPETKELFQSLVSTQADPFIVDGGANIGASSCFFALEYPGAKVLAYEPDPHNFELLAMNSVGLDVELHKAALGSRNGKARIVDPGIGEWGYRTEITESGAC